MGKDVKDIPGAGAAGGLGAGLMAFVNAATSMQMMNTQSSNQA